MTLAEPHLPPRDPEPVLPFPDPMPDFPEPDVDVPEAPPFRM
jgi:hypothetical protein